MLLVLLLSCYTAPPPVAADSGWSSAGCGGMIRCDDGACSESCTSCDAGCCSSHDGC